MSSILIPTDYQQDTLHALEMTWRIGGTSPLQVVLLSFSPVPDTITDYILMPSRKQESESRRKLMEDWGTMKSLIDNQVQLREHHQYGASFPVIEQIMERYEAEQIIVPYSFQKSESIIHLSAMRSFKKSGHKIVVMPRPHAVMSFNDEEYKISGNESFELVGK